MVTIKSSHPDEEMYCCIADLKHIKYGLNPVAIHEDKTDSGGIRTHASEETGALNQRLRPLGHAT